MGPSAQSGREFARTMGARRHTKNHVESVKMQHQNLEALLQVAAGLPSATQRQATPNPLLQMFQLQQLQGQQAQQPLGNQGLSYSTLGNMMHQVQQGDTNLLAQALLQKAERDALVQKETQRQLQQQMANQIERQLQQQASQLQASQTQAIMATMAQLREQASFLTQEQALQLVQISMDTKYGSTPEQRNETMQKALRLLVQQRNSMAVNQTLPPQMSPNMQTSQPLAKPVKNQPIQETDPTHPNFATLYHMISPSKRPIEPAIEPSHAVGKLQELYIMRTKGEYLAFAWSEPHPKHGFLFFFEIPAGQAKLPPDTLYWLQDEKLVGSHDVNGQKFEIWERRGGFKDGETSATLKRLRFRLSAPPDMPFDFQFIQYLTMDQAMPVVKSEVDNGISGVQVPPTLPTLAQNYMLSAGQVPANVGMLNAAFQQGI
jgi:hypothetical protein